MFQSLTIVAIEQNPEDAERFFTTIKKSGFGVKPFSVTDEDTLATTIDSKSPDLFIYRLSDNPTIPLKKVESLRDMSGLRSPIIAIADENVDFTIAECLKQGATDVVQLDDLEHFKLVLARSLASSQAMRELLDLKNQLVESQQQCNTLINSSKDAIAYIHEGMHIDVNGAYLELFGMKDQTDIDGLSFIDLVTSEEQDSMKSFLKDYAKDPASNAKHTTMIKAAQDVTLRETIEFSPARVDGEDCTQVVIRAESPALTGQTGQILSNTAQTEFLASHDISSGLQNRTALLEALENTVNTADDSDQKSALVLCRIDKYDNLQSELGVLRADQFFGKVGTLLTQVAVGTHNMARFDTSVFGFIIDAENEDDLKEKIGSITRAVKGHVLEIDGKSASCTLSVGATFIYVTAVDSSEVVSRATKSLIKAAKQGDSLEVYIPDDNEKSQKQIDDEWGATLKEALKEDRLRLAFQPIASLLNDGKKRYTIYIRMLDSHGKLLDAAEFMPSIERISLAVGLDRFVLLKSLKLLSKENDENIIFFIKLTSGTLQNPDTFKWYREQILSHNVKPSQIVFELKSSTINNYIKAAKEFNKIIKPIGCKMVVEGLSSGNNPFQLFKHIDAEYIKIGQEYIKDINNSDENKTVIRDIAKEAQARKQQLIVQHIENAQQLTALWGLSVHYVQGNFLQPPSPAMNYDFDSIG